MADQAALVETKNENTEPLTLEEAFDAGINSFGQYLGELSEGDRERLIQAIEKQIN